MKKSNLIFILLVSAFSGCHTDTNPIATSSDQSGILTSLNGQITPWQFGTHRTLLFIGYGDTPSQNKPYAFSSIDSAGNFSLQNLAVPSPSQPNHIVYPTLPAGWTYIQNTLTCSDSSARECFGQLIVVNDTSSIPLGVVQRQSYVGSVLFEEHFTVDYLYLNADVKLSGTQIDTFYNSTEFRMTKHYDLTFKKGWNKQVTYALAAKFLRDSTKATQIQEIFYTTQEPYDGKWAYYGY